MIVGGKFEPTGFAALLGEKDIRLTLAAAEERQMRKSWYVAFFQLPKLPERMLTMNGGAIVGRMFDGVALPPDVLAVYIRQITERGAATAMLNWNRAIRLQNSRTLNLAQVIGVPTLVVWGERDVALDPICLNGTERYVRDLRVKRLPGVSHCRTSRSPIVS